MSPIQSERLSRCNPKWSWHGRCPSTAMWSPPEQSCLAIPTGAVRSARLFPFSAADYGQRGEAAGVGAQDLKGTSKVTALYNWPLSWLRSLFCLVQRSFPSFAGVVLSAVLRKDSVSNFEIAMGCATVAGCIPGTIKLLHCGLADWAKEGPGQRSTTLRTLQGYLNREPEHKARLGSRISEINLRTRRAQQFKLKASKSNLNCYICSSIFGKATYPTSHLEASING
jgi:hypothetical protein